MQHSNRWRGAALLLLVAALGLGVSACTRAQASGEAEGGTSDAFRLEPVKGTELNRVILSEKAASRLGIQTTRVRNVIATSQRPDSAAASGSGTVTARRAIPYGAVLYDEKGDTWTFTSPAPLTFLRQKITVDHIDGDLAVLSDGPAAGATVVTVGAAELLGAELGVGGE